MVTELLMKLLAGVLAAAISLLPSLPMPDYVRSGQLARTVGGAVDALSGLGGWLPGPQLGAAAALVALALVVTVAVQVVRIVLSFLTLGGGAT